MKKVKYNGQLDGVIVMIPSAPLVVNKDDVIDVPDDFFNGNFDDVIDVAPVTKSSK